MICFAKPWLTQNLYVVYEEECSVTRYVWDMYTMYKKQTHPLVREGVS
jgi:hypothetical protein